jgi:hypothetical protein
VNSSLKESFHFLPLAGATGGAAGQPAVPPAIVQPDVPALDGFAEARGPALALVKGDGEAEAADDGVAVDKGAEEPSVPSSGPLALGVCADEEVSVSEATPHAPPARSTTPAVAAAATHLKECGRREDDRPGCEAWSILPFCSVRLVQAARLVGTTGDHNGRLSRSTTGTEADLIPSGGRAGR